MIPILYWLAAANGGEMNVVSTAAITAVCSALTGAALYFKGKQQRNVTIDKQPVGVRLHDAWVTRTEMAEFKAEIRGEVKEMRGSYDRLIMLIDERDKKLSEMIERVAAGAFEGRRRIHEEVNAQGKKLEAIGVNTDVSKNIGKLGAALMTHIKNCPIANQNQARQG